MAVPTAHELHSARSAARVKRPSDCIAQTRLYLRAHGNADPYGRANAGSNRATHGYAHTGSHGCTYGHAYQSADRHADRAADSRAFALSLSGAHKSASGNAKARKYCDSSD